MKHLSSLALLFISCLLLFACTNEKAVEIIPVPSGINKDSISYSKHIKRIVTTRCYEGKDGNTSCHQPPDLSDVDFTTYEGFTTYSGKRISDAINQNGDAIPMPFRNPKIPQLEIDTIQAWIDNGRLNN